MDTKLRLLTGVVALSLANSILLATSNASASPHENGHHNHQYSNPYNGHGYQTGPYSGRYGNGQLDNRYEHRGGNYSDQRGYSSYGNQHGNYSDQRGYPSYGNQRGYTPERFMVRLPQDYRRVVYRNQTYYTRNNDFYYSYDPFRRAYILVDLPGISIRF